MCTTLQPPPARGSPLKTHGRWVVRVVREVGMGCSHANGSHTSPAKAVIELVPSAKPLNWQSASIVHVSGDMRIASPTMPFQKGRPASRKVAPEWRKVEL